jgi:hypothetical protein
MSCFVYRSKNGLPSIKYTFSLDLPNLFNFCVLTGFYDSMFFYHFHGKLSNL